MVIMFYVFFIKRRGLKNNTGNNVNGINMVSGNLPESILFRWELYLTEFSGLE